jgi:hypothetical protein
MAPDSAGVSRPQANRVECPRMGADSDQRDTPPVSSPAPKTASWLIPALVAGVTLVTFLPALRCGFVNWDDDRNLIANPMFRGFDADRLAWMFTTFYGGHYQPLTWLSYAVDHAVWGMRPVGYHLTNTLLHTLCAVLFYVVAIRVLTRVTDRPGPEREPLLRSGEAVVKWAAGFAALLFAVHPLRVESVVWATERRDVLSGVFFLASLLAYMRAIDRARGSWRWHLAAWACMLLSLGAKAIGMILPVVMLVMDVYLRGGWRAGAVRRRTILIEKIPYAMLAGTAAWVAMQAQRSAGAWRPLADFGWLERMVAAGYSAWFYLAKWVAPHGLAPLYPLPEDRSVADGAVCHTGRSGGRAAGCGLYRSTKAAGVAGGAGCVRGDSCAGFGRGPERKAPGRGSVQLFGAVADGAAGWGGGHVVDSAGDWERY